MPTQTAHLQCKKSYKYAYANAYVHVPVYDIPECKITADKGHLLEENTICQGILHLDNTLSN